MNSNVENPNKKAGEKRKRERSHSLAQNLHGNIIPRHYCKVQVRLDLNL